jgi:hypothetical protein
MREVEVMYAANDRVYSQYLLRLSEFRRLYAERHEPTLLDTFEDSGAVYAMSRAQGALKDLRISKYLLELVNDDVLIKNF